MLAYNKTYFDNFFILEKAKEWIKYGLIGDSEYEAILKRHPSPYKGFNVFARIALFIFTMFIISSAIGLVNILFGIIEFYRFVTFQCFFFGVGSYVLAEVSVRKLNFFRSGIKEALLYNAIFSIAFGVIELITGNTFNFNVDPLIYFLCILPIVAYGAIRFADRFLSLGGFVLLIIIDALIVLKLGIFGKMILPFESMVFSFLIYYISVKLKKKEELYYWKSCIGLIQGASLITLYLSGNYMVVRTLTEALLNTVIEPGEDIHLAILFYAYTIIVPLVYIWIGLKRKEYVFFRAGILLEITGILAIKYYHSIMPPETAMMLGGIVVIVIAYFSIKYLKTPKHGITFEIYKRSNKEEALANIASIVASKLVATQPLPQRDSSMEPGGGQFGGGGAGADY